jgi:hypothetical protein
MKKESGKKLIFVLLIGLLLISSISFVLSQQTTTNPEDAAMTLREVGNWIGRFILTTLFGSSTPDPKEAVTHIFMGLVLFLLIYSIFDAMQFFGDEKKIFDWLISIGVTMLVLMALPPDFFNYILPSYGAMGAAILTMLPFLAIFIFSIRVRSIFFAQMTWMFFAIYFIGFYGLSAIGAYDGSKEIYNNVPAILYLIIGLAGLGMMWFIPLVRQLFGRGKRNEAVKDIENAGKLNKALMKARAEEMKGLRDEQETATK